MSDNRVELRNVSKRYGPRVILDDISVTIGAGEIVALIGPSGGGKSTMLRCINGLNRFDQGEIMVGDCALRPNSTITELRRVRQMFGMIFQDFQLFPHLSAVGNVTLAPQQVLGMGNEESKKLAKILLTRMGLADRMDAMPHQLSGGQKQRVAIARALAMSPRGLLCDEITSALDPELKADVLDALLDLKKEGMTLIMVTHEIHFARRAADRVFILADGQIVEQGPPSHVLDNPTSSRAQKFLSRVLA